MLIDCLDESTAFSFHIPSDGSEIGGVDPLKYGIFPVLSEKPGWQMWTEGNASPPGYPAVMFYPAVSSDGNAVAVPRTILPNSGNLSLAFDLLVGNASLIGGNVIESDLLIVSGGYKYNLSGQRHFANGQIDIGGWTDSTLRVGPLTANVKHKIRWRYSFDLTAKICSVLSYSCDSLTWGIPANMQGMAATASSWPDGAYLQFQLGSLPNGEPWAARVRNVKLEWA